MTLKISSFFVRPLFHLLLLMASKTSVTNALDLPSMATYLRDGDVRLVRPSITEETFERQTSGKGCAQLDDVITILKTTANDPKTKREAMEVAMLCTTDNPTHRQQIGQVEGVHESIVDALRIQGKVATAAEDVVLAAAQAAELIWILSFDSKVHHEGFVKAGAVKALGDIIVNCHHDDDEDHADEDKDDKEECLPYLIMWCSAALQNLAASYCKTDDGRCSWMLDDEGELVLEEDSPLVVDSEPVRKMIAERHELVEELRDLVCHYGPVPDDDEEEEVWPSTAEIHQDEHSQNIIAWAAAGALKNLALSPGARDDVREAELCLCSLMSSPDWLESSKAEHALYNLGRDLACHPDIPCIDWEWHNEHDESCDEYEDDHCEEHGSDENHEGIKAWEACCACGGGERGEPEEEDIKDEL